MTCTKNKTEKNMNDPKTIDVSIEKMDVMPSTNDCLALICREGKAEEFYTVVTEFQTAGKGQRGNSWESEAGKNLLFSTVLYPTALEAKHQFYVSMLAALAIHEALSSYTSGFSIKWPNDIYWKNQKIAGILIENEIEGKYLNQSIIGVGLNVNQEKFLSDAPNPVSLKQIIGADIDRQELLEKILHGIIGGYHQLEENFERTSQTIGLLYLKHFYRRKGLHTYRDADGIFRAKFHRMEEDGRLLLKDEEGIVRRYAFKEVEFVIDETD